MDVSQCLCGRNVNKAHCPHCGSAMVYGLSTRTDSVTRADGSRVTLRVWRCRMCQAIFNEDDWKLRCSAPPPRNGRRSVNTRDKKPSEVLVPEVVDALKGSTVDVIPADRDYNDLSQAARMARMNELLRKAQGE